MVTIASNIKLVTGFSVDGYKLYGKRMVESVTKYCDPENTILYLTNYFKNRNGIYRDLVNFPGSIREQNRIPNLMKFLDRHQTSASIRGLDPVEGWKQKEINNGYSFRFDAHKFCKMAMFTYDATLDGMDYLIYLDGDTVFRQPISLFDIVKKSLNGCDYAYLGRESKYSETGFLVFKLPNSIPILEAWSNFYSSDKFLLQPEWHSAFLFDKACEMYKEIKGNNLTPGGSGHVIHKCWVGQYIDHLKGNRKLKGFSREAKPIRRK